MKTLLWVAVSIAILALMIWYEIAVWQECLATNHWFYCLRVLSH
jgi:hypothetical protein